MLTLPEISIEKLTLSLRAPTTPIGGVAASSGKKNKSKAAAADKDILVDANVKFQAGVHYGLLGRNGSGKSSEHGSWAVRQETAC